MVIARSRRWLWRRLGHPLGRADAQWGDGRIAWRCVAVAFATSADFDLSASLRPRDRDHRDGCVDRLFHRTRQRTAQARMADGGSQWQSRNAREGREYPLVKPVTVIGRAEESDIGLFGDQAVLAQHAIIRREGKDFFVSPAAVARCSSIASRLAAAIRSRSGDRVEIGGTLFLFRERAKPRKGDCPELSTAALLQRPRRLAIAMLLVSFSPAAPPPRTKTSIVSSRCRFRPSIITRFRSRVIRRPSPSGT